MSAAGIMEPPADDEDLAILATAADANELLIVGAGFEAGRRNRRVCDCPDYGGNERWQKLWKAGLLARQRKDAAR
jgi:hypothetical protein